jgi:hypothetical protein
MSMIAHAGTSGVRVSDEALLLAIVGTLAATFIAVWLYVLFKLTDGACRLLVERTRKRIRRSRRLLATPRVGRVLRAADVISALSTAGLVAICMAMFLLLLAPILLAVGAFELAASLISIKP